MWREQYYWIYESCKIVSDSIIERMWPEVKIPERGVKEEVQACEKNGGDVGARGDEACERWWWW